MLQEGKKDPYYVLSSKKQEPSYFYRVKSGKHHTKLSFIQSLPEIHNMDMLQVNCLSSL